MFYFIGFGILLALLLKRNPICIVSQINFRVPYLLISGLLLQVLLELTKPLGFRLNAYFLAAAFLMVLAGLFLNRSFVGVKWIFAGCLLNELVLILNGGLMPVSQTAMHFAGVAQFALIDARHQMMTSGQSILWLGDWIPFIKHVLSPGDVLVGVGMIRFIVCYSGTKESSR